MALPFLVYFYGIGVNLVPTEIYQNILNKEDSTLNIIYIIFLLLFFSSVLLSTINKNINFKIRSLLNSANKNRIFNCTTISTYIYMLFLFSSFIFLLFFNHTIFEWSTSGEINSIIRLSNSNFLANDFYTNSMQHSPKYLFSYFIHVFSFISLDWYKVLYFIKWFTAISVPPLLFILYTKVLKYWNPEGFDEEFKNKILPIIFVGLLGPFCFLQIIPRMDPFGWGAIQYFTAADPMRVSFVIGLLYLILHFLNKPYFFLKLIFLSISTLMHPAVGICNYFISMNLVLPKDKSKQKIIEFIFLFLISLITPLLILSVLFDSGNFVSSKEFFDIYIASRHPHHYLISDIFDIHSIIWIFLMILPIGLSFILKNKQLILLTSVSLLLMFLAVFIQFIFSEIFPLKIIMKAGPSRYTAYLSLILSLNSLIIFSFLFKTEYLNVIKNNFIYDFFKLLSIKINNLFHKLEKHIKRKRLIFLLGIAFIISTFISTYQLPMERNDDGSTLETINWIKNNTPKNSVIFSPPLSLDPAIIRVYSERAVYADWMFPFNEQYMKEFAKRYDFYKLSSKFSLEDYSCSNLNEFDFLVLKNNGKHSERAEFISQIWLVFDTSKLICP